MDNIRDIMTLIDKNQDNINQGEYLEICNKLKEVYETKEQYVSCEWTDIMKIYKNWKMSVRHAMEADKKMEKIDDMYDNYLKNIPSEECIFSICLKHYTEKNKLNITGETESHVRENMKDICQDIVDIYIDAFRTHKYDADEYWKKLTNCDNFREFMDLLSPIELFTHRELCKIDGDIMNRVCRQKPKTVIYDGAYITKEFKWFSHERIYPEMDNQEEDFEVPE